MATSNEYISELYRRQKKLVPNKNCTEAEARSRASSEPDTIFFSSDTHTIVIGGEVSSVPIDSDLSATSVNPVQNKVVTDALDEKQDIMEFMTNQDINELFNSIL